MAKYKPLIAVKWLDHTSCDGWIKAENIKKTLKCPIITSVGWLMSEDDEAYYLFSSYNALDGDIGDSRCILKANVVEVIGIPVP